MGSSKKLVEIERHRVRCRRVVKTEGGHRSQVRWRGRTLGSQRKSMLAYSLRLSELVGPNVAAAYSLDGRSQNRLGVRSEVTEDGRTGPVLSAGSADIEVPQLEGS